MTEEKEYQKRDSDYKKRRGKICALYRFPEKRMPAVSEEELMLQEGSGIAGDCHADGGTRQISLLTVEEQEWMRQQEIQGFCFRKFKENILLDGISLADCAPGDVLVCEEAQMELSAFVKRCQRELCRLAKEEVDCPFADSVRFAFVKKSGIIRNGMNVQIDDRNVMETE